MFNPFRKKRMEPPPPLPPEPVTGRVVPTHEVQALSSRGVPEPDIINTLRREGYSTREIDQAMKEALRSRVSRERYPPPRRSPYPPEPEPPEYSDEDYPPPETEEPFPEELPRQLAYPGTDVGEPLPERFPVPREPEYPDMPRGGDFAGESRMRPEISAPSPRRSAKSGVDRREIEELTEVIVDERVRELRERFKSVQSQMKQTESRIESLANEINRLKMDKGGDVRGIEQKIDNYSKGMQELNGRIDSMERALKDSLSPMLESLRSLSDTIKALKENK